ncbi:MAG: sulfite exporter TauE/SafE family protein [Flavisolibacter sp.]
MPSLLFLMFAFMLAGWIQGLTGFGFAVATTLLLVNHMDFTLLVFFNLCLSVLTSLVAMLSGQNIRSIHRPTLLKLIISAFAGLVVGLAIISYVDAQILKRITLGVILLASVVSLTKRKAFFANSYMSWIGGFFSGVLTPSTGINGPLVALHLNAAFINKEQVRSTMLAYLFLIMTFGVISMSLQIDLSPNDLSLLSKMVVPALVGYVLGMFTFRRLPNRVYQLVVSLFLILSSLISLIYLIVK